MSYIFAICVSVNGHLRLFFLAWRNNSDHCLTFLQNMLSLNAMSQHCKTRGICQEKTKFPQTYHTEFMEQPNPLTESQTECVFFSLISMFLHFILFYQKKNNSLFYERYSKCLLFRV